MTLYEKHVRDWSNCTKCALQHCRSRVVLGRGDYPCDVLMVGEAPGFSENSWGEPFMGPAGHLLDNIVQWASSGSPPLRFAFTNLVCCIPLNEDGDKASEPDPVEITACGDRLREFVGIVKPRLIVAVGELPKRWIPELLPKYTGNVGNIIHPAAILRQPAIQKSGSVDRAVINLKKALAEIV